MQAIETLGILGIAAGAVVCACSRRVKDEGLNSFLLGLGFGLAFTGGTLWLFLSLAVRPG